MFTDRMSIKYVYVFLKSFPSSFDHVCGGPVHRGVINVMCESCKWSAAILLVGTGLAGIPSSGRTRGDSRI